MQRQPLRFPSSSAASSPRTNPLRSNNERDRDDPSSSMDRSMSSGVGRSSSGSEVDASQTLDERLAEEQRGMQKLNKVVQEFFNKAALVIAGSRHNLSPKYGNGQVRSNKWFNVVLQDTNDLAESLLEWKTLNVFDALPPSLVIEIYLDLSDLTASQALVVLDKQGRRWDVAEALSLPNEYNTRSSGGTSRKKELVVERWRIEIGESSTVIPSSEIVLPDAYKKAVVLFRSLFTYTRILPAWQYFKHLSKGSSNNAGLKLKYRISNGDSQPKVRDTLETALIPDSNTVTSRYVFEPSMSPVGPFCISVTYRDTCDFRVDDSESLLSSHFMASDDTYFRPSLDPRRESNQDNVPGSLPARKQYLEDRQDPAQAYGSLSTFHGAGQLGTSPLSALRDAHWPGGGQSPAESPPQKLLPTHRPGQGSKSSLRSNDAVAAPQFQRRTSVSFQPFKAGSLASSPASGMMYGPVPPSPSSSSLGRGQSPLTQAGMSSPVSTAQKRNSLNHLPQQALRTPIPIPNDTAVTSSASSSPKPAPISTRYSSSFSNRRHRFSSASAGTGTGPSNSKTEDGEPSGGQNSSGKGSASSSTRVDMSNPDMTVTAATVGAEGNGSGTMQADDDNLKDFIKLLEQKKELRSFNRTDEKAREATIMRTTAALSKYQRMRDSNAALSDSLGSSLLLHRSSSSSSRQLSAVPPMIADRGGSFESSSPGKPVSPHTPHTPAIPSRLSAGSVLAYDEVRRSRSGNRSATRRRSAARNEADAEQDVELPNLEREGSNAIPIPTSPRPWPYVRRSSSVAQQHRQAALEDAEVDLYGLRSASLPTEERGEVSLSELLQMNEESVQAEAGPALEQSSADDVDAGQYSGGDAAADNLPFRTRMSQRGRWRIPTVSSSNSSSAAHPSSAPAPTGSRGFRTNFGNRAALQREEDDEPLLFAMSELEAQSRRSLEEARGGSYFSAARGRGATNNSGSGSGSGSGRLGGDW